MENSRKSIARPLIVVALLVFLVMGAVVASAALSWNNVPMVGASAGPAAALSLNNVPMVGASAAPAAAELDSAALTTASDVTLTGVAEEPMTILLLGIGTPENEADAIYVLAVDPASGAVDVTAFAPSMMMATKETEDRIERIWRTAFYGSVGNDSDAAAAVAEALEETYDITVDHYAVVREAALASMVDAIGGLDVDVPVPVPYHGISAGAQLFDGETTWKYVVWIPGPSVVPLDLERIERHKHVIDALREKLTTPATLLKLPALLSQLLTNDVVMTDLSIREVLDLLNVLKTLPDEQITVTVVPTID